MTNFDVWVEDDRIRVQFVSRKALGRLPSGHPSGGDYGDGVVRLPRWETRSTNRSSLFHEIGHHLINRSELRPRDTTEEEICDIMSWIPMIILDERNVELRRFLGVTKDG